MVFQQVGEADLEKAVKHGVVVWIAYRSSKGLIEEIQCRKVKLCRHLVNEIFHPVIQSLRHHKSFLVVNGYLYIRGGGSSRIMHT